MDLEKKVKGVIRWPRIGLVVVITLLLIIFISIINKCQRERQNKEISYEQKLRDSEQKRIEQNNKLIADKDQIIRKYIDCARQNDSLTQIAATKIDNESVQREKDITTRVIPDIELQRQMSDFYRKFNR